MNLVNLVNWVGLDLDFGNWVCGVYGNFDALLFLFV